MVESDVLLARELRLLHREKPPSPSALSALTETIGAKAAGLLRLPTLWTIPDFAVLTAQRCERFRHTADPSVLEDAAGRILVELPLSKSDRRLMVRSSVVDESLGDRGRYSSLVTNASKETLVEAMIEVLRSVERAATDSSAQRPCSLLIHEYIPSSYCGHLSNERRVGPRRSFLAELWRWNGLQPERSFTLQSKKDINEPQESERIRVHLRSYPEALRRLARWLHQHIGRVHVEWLVWDGHLIIVQCDVESEASVPPPLYQWTQGIKAQAPPRLDIFSPVTRDNSGDLRKTKSVLVFSDCNLKIAPLYVLRDEATLAALISGTIPDPVRRDLEQLTTSPLVVRVDVVELGNQDWQNLPASAPLKSVAAVTAFLRETLPTARGRVDSTRALAVVVHHFIASRAAAWAEAVDDSRRVRIDAIWGLPDGLQSFPCDSVYISERDQGQFVLRRFKDMYLDLDADGRIYKRFNGPPWDKEPVLQDNDAEEIATKSLTVSKYLGKPVRLMWFIGTVGREDIPRCFPWIVVPEFEATADPFLHGRSDIPVLSDLETIRQARRLALGRVRRIGRQQDLDDFARSSDEFDLGGHRVVFRPDPELIRSREFLRTVAEAVATKRWQLVLEGSSLAHTFYQLRQLGVGVECASSFLSKPKRRKVFMKLVRDLVPQTIRAHGEIAEVRELSKAEMRGALARKLIEESFEVDAAESPEAQLEELADVYEVVVALAGSMDSTLEDVAERARDKREKRGGFDAGYELLATGGVRQVAPEQRRRTPYVRVRGAGRRVEIPIPLVPPVNRQLIESIKASFGDAEIHITVRYTDTYAYVQFSLEEQRGDERQLPLFVKPTDGS